MFATFTDADLLAEVERRSLTEHVRHAAVEAQVRANYQLGEVLGEGSSAKVYSATHLLTGEGFAIKWINKGGQMNDTASMRAELSILKQLHHAHLVNLHEVYESESTLWLVMEKVEGGELLAYLEQRRHLSEACVRDIARQLCSSLHYIHSSGVVHRDMKLENVLRATSEPDACVKVADFGLAAILPAFKKNKFEPNASVKRKASTDLTDCWGTPQYFAPELIDEQYGTQVDVWSLGCMIYELLSGHKLFGADELGDNLEAFWADQKAQDQLWADIHAGVPARAFEDGERWDAKISADCVSFLRQLLEVDPAKRLSAGEALRHPWMDDSRGSAAATHHMERTHGKLMGRRRLRKRSGGAAASQTTEAGVSTRVARQLPRRHRIAPHRWADDPLSKANLGGRQAKLDQLRGS